MDIQTARSSKAVSPLVPSVVPLGLARSALFGTSCVVKNVETREPIKQFLTNPEIAPQRNNKLTYRGPLLNQHHALVWQGVLHLASPTSNILKELVHIQPDAFLRLIGRKGGDHKQRKLLFGWLSDLYEANITYSTVTHNYMGRLLTAICQEKKTGHITIRLNPDLTHLLGNEVLVNDLRRKASLGKNQLAMWLHDYLATHQMPPADLVETLRKLSGSSLKLPQFRHRLRSALALLTGQTAEHLICQWTIDPRDRLIVEKKPTSVKLLGASVTDIKVAATARNNKKKEAIDQACKLRAGNPL